MCYPHSILIIIFVKLGYNLPCVVDKRYNSDTVGRVGILVNWAGLEKITLWKIDKYVIVFCYYCLLKGGWKMEKHILVVALNCSDPAKEDEFNEWYNTTHLPDVLETPGFIRATRWEHTDPKEEDAKFLALYDIETDDIQAAMKALQENLDAKREAGRMSNLGSRVFRGVYKQISSLEK